MALPAHRTGRLQNQADIAHHAALPHTTAHRYLNLLETGCPISQIRPYASNPSIPLVKTPKLLWTDRGLAASLAGIKTRAELANRPDAGFWLEQRLFENLQTWRALDPLHRQVDFWRDRLGHKVDFILEQDGELVALGIKAGSTVPHCDAVGIRDSRDSSKKKPTLVRTVALLACQASPLDTDTVALPWVGWWEKTKATQVAVDAVLGRRQRSPKDWGPRSGTAGSCPKRNAGRSGGTDPRTWS